MIVVMLGFLLLMIAITAAANRAYCAWYGYQTERQTRYATLVGCMVQMHGAWVPRTEIRTAQ